MRIRAYIFLVLVVALGTGMRGRVYAQDIAAEMQQVHRTYATQDGLPQASAYTLEIDHRGWLWVGTQNGVAYNNGRTWKALTALNRDMHTGFWRGDRILNDAAGDMWFGTEDKGIYRLHATPGVPPTSWPWTHYTRRDGLPSDTIRVIHQSPDGTIWTGTATGLATWQDSTWQIVDAPDALSSSEVFAVYDREDGALWVGSQAGLFVYRGGRWHQPALPEPLPGRSVHAIFEDEQGTLWLAMSGAVASQTHGRWTVHRSRPADVPPSQRRTFINIVDQPDGSLWFATFEDGIMIREPDGSWNTLGTANGLPSTTIHDILRHPDGSFWIGTANGLSVRKSNEWFTLNKASGLESDVLWSIQELSDGSFWFGTEDHLTIYRDGRWNRLDGPGGVPFTRTMAVHEARDGVIWIATSEGVFAIRDGQWVFSDRNQYVYDILETRDGRLFFGTRSGVLQYVDGHLARFAPEQKALQRSIRMIGEASDGSLWFGASGLGLVRYDGTSWTTFTPADGVAGRTSLDMFEDQRGLLWFPSTEGVSLFDGAHWRVLSDTTTVQLPDPFTYRVEQDAEGRYYVSSNQGILRLTPRSAAADANVPLDSLQFSVERFGLADGLLNLESNQGASLRDRQGRIWFGTIAGAVMYVPGEHPKTETAPAISIENVEVPGLDDAEMTRRFEASGGALALDHTERDIHFEFALGTPGDPNDVRYRTQLIGYDPQPSSWTPVPTRTYTNLPYGTYTFTVTGRSADGRVSEPTQLTFTIARAPWHTWGAYLLYTLLAGAVLVGLIRWQNDRVRRRQDQLVAIERERLSREAAEAQARVAETQAQLLRSENQRLSELNEANEFRQRVLEGATDAIFALDLDGCVTLFNPRLMEITGSSKSALMGSRLAFFFNDESTPKVERAFEYVLREKRPVRALEVQVGHDDQEGSCLSMTLSPLMNERTVMGVVGTAEDISEKRRLEQFRDDMLRMLVHDLRNPLSVVQMVSQELKEDPEMPTEIRSEMADIVQRNSEQALKLVNKILDVSRLEAGKMPVKLDRVSLAQVARTVAEPMHPMLEEGRIALDIELEDDLADVKADPELLRRVLQNLLSNAIKFTPSGGRITIAATAEADRMNLRVTDTGPGVPPAVQQTLFQKFSTSRAGIGTGLGLAFCRLAVDAMGGRIWLDDTWTDGASFQLTLPYYDASASHLPDHQGTRTMARVSS